MTEYLCLYIEDGHCVVEGCAPLTNSARTFSSAQITAEDILKAFEGMVHLDTFVVLQTQWDRIKDRMNQGKGIVVVGPQFVTVNSQKNGRALSKIAAVV